MIEFCPMGGIVVGRTHFISFHSIDCSFINMPCGYLAYCQDIRLILSWLHLSPGLSVELGLFRSAWQKCPHWKTHTFGSTYLPRATSFSASEYPCHLNRNARIRKYAHIYTACEIYFLSVHTCTQYVRTYVRIYS